MNKLLTRQLGVAVAAAAISFASQAATWTAQATLTGAQEVPPNASTAQGTFSIAYDSSTGVFDWTLTFFGLSAPVTAAHIHGPAGPGVNAPPIFDLEPLIGSTLFLGGTFGMKQVNGDFSDQLGRTLQSKEADFLAGMTYVNVHDSSFPGGEIRAQLLPVPEPETYTMMLAGLGIIGVIALRRRKMVV